MGLRINKPKNFGPFRVTFAKTGIGISVGFGARRIGVTTRGEWYSSLTIPGTGIGFRKRGSLKSKAPCKSRAKQDDQQIPCQTDYLPDPSEDQKWQDALMYANWLHSNVQRIEHNQAPLAPNGQPVEPADSAQSRAGLWYDPSRTPNSPSNASASVPV